jgi:hypothetical protein
MHQNSGFTMLTASEVRNAKPLRQARHLSDRRGLYLLVAPNGGRYWRYNYRFNGKYKTLALGIYTKKRETSSRTASIRRSRNERREGLWETRPNRRSRVDQALAND